MPRIGAASDVGDPRQNEYLYLVRILSHQFGRAVVRRPPSMMRCSRSHPFVSELFNGPPGRSGGFSRQWWAIAIQAGCNDRDNGLWMASASVQSDQNTVTVMPSGALAHRLGACKLMHRPAISDHGSRVIVRQSAALFHPKAFIPYPFTGVQSVDLCTIWF